MPVWRFRPHRGDEKIRNPIQGEFFSEEAVEKPAQALVREVIQNSLDARAGADPVEVRFTVSADHGLGPEAGGRWLLDAWEHLRAEGSGLRSVPPRPPAGRFLTIEDFGTTGLEGEPAELRPTTAPSRLFAFFRAEGISQKGGRDGGRWGVGKTVFLRSSDINTLLALTVRRSDERCLVFGQAVLRYHWLNGTYFTPDGAFGEAGTEGAVLPSEEPRLGERFRRDFNLARTTQPGLSVVVPYASEELTGPAILEAVIREYFYPILSGQLVVAVNDPSLPCGPRTLTADTLLEELIQMKTDVKDSVGPLAALTIWLKREGLDRATVLEPPEPGTPEWSAAAFSASARETLAAAYRRGDTVLVKVPLTVSPVGEPPRETFFHVVLRRDLTDRGAAPAFVRNGIQIPKALERRVRGQSLWALVLIEDQSIATLLGDAETPAHTHWSKDTQNFRHKYRYGAATIDFVRGAPRFIAETLSESARERDFFSLVDFFPVPRDGPGAVAPPPRPKPSDKDGSSPPAPNAPSTTDAYRVDRLEGGFRISPGRVAPNDHVFSVAVAYDCTRGQPLKKWDPRDFDLSGLPKQLEGLRLLRCAGNELVLKPERPEFRIEVTGFDVNRDLLLRIAPGEDGVDSAA
jgi:hypothetical protein